MLSIKVKTIISAIITIIIVALFWLFLPEEKASETPPKGNNTLYVQSSLPGECRAIITSILDGRKLASSEIPCQMQLRPKK